jgi:S1-C subfamily serine protease
MTGAVKTSCFTAGLWLLVVLVLCVVANVGLAAPDARYVAAEKSFNARVLSDRVRQQTWLATAGYLPKTYGTTFTPELYDGLLKFQRQNDWPQTGNFEAEQKDALAALHLVAQIALDFRPRAHPTEALPIWVPMGIDLDEETYEGGIGWENKEKTIGVFYVYHPDVTVTQALDEDVGAATKEGRTFLHRALTDRHYELTTSNDKTGTVVHATFHRHKRGVIGVYITWRLLADQGVVRPIIATTTSSLAFSVAGIELPLLLPGGPGHPYLAAERTAKQAGVRHNLRQQLLLAAAGYLKSPLSDEFHLDVYTAIIKFQKSLGQEMTGILTESQLRELEGRALPLLAKWDFTERPHPREGRPIWVPSGYETSLTPFGLQLAYKGRSLLLQYDYISSVSLQETHEIALEVASEDGNQLAFDQVRNSHFTTRTIFKDGNPSLNVQHSHRDGTMGLLAHWSRPPNAEDEAVGNIMASSLHAALLRRPFLSPSDVLAPVSQSPPAPGGIAAPAAPSFTASGIFVSDAGHVLTTVHAVAACTAIEAALPSGETSLAEIVAGDVTNNLALLKTNFAGTTAADFRSSIRHSDPVFTVVPPDAPKKPGRISGAKVTSLSGAGGDSRILEVSAAVTEQQSGGPVLNAAGQVVGLVSVPPGDEEPGTGTDKKGPSSSVAIKSVITIGFLESNRIVTARGAAKEALPATSLEARGRAITLFLRCVE